MKTLNKILLFCIGILPSLSFSGCSRSQEEYSYNGKIGEEKVEFKEEKRLFFQDNNYLAVTKKDGRQIIYVDNLNEDLKLDYVTILFEKEGITYIKDEIGTSIIKEAQKQFDEYLIQIKELNAQEKLGQIKKGLESLR